MAENTDSFVKLSRRLLSWEWMSEPNTLAVFIFCLLSASWCDTRYKGIELKRGEFVTTLPELCQKTGLTIQQARTAISHLKSTGELTDKTTSKYRIITMVNYTKLQDANSQTNSQLTGKQQASNRQLTDKHTIYKRNKEIKEVKERENDLFGDPFASPKADTQAKEPRKHKHGEYNNVLLTDEELEKLREEYSDCEERIDRLSGYIASTGKAYKSHFATIRNWAKSDREKEKTKKRVGPNGIVLSDEPSILDDLF